MTITVPCRRMTLPRSQRALTDALTFTIAPALLESIRDPATRQVVRRQLDADPVARKDPDEVHAELAADVGEYPMTVLELDSEHRIGQRLDDRTLDLDRVLLGHRRRQAPCSIPAGSTPARGGAARPARHGDACAALGGGTNGQGIRGGPRPGSARSRRRLGGGGAG